MIFSICTNSSRTFSNPFFRIPKHNSSKLKGWLPVSKNHWHNIFPLFPSKIPLFNGPNQLPKTADGTIKKSDVLTFTFLSSSKGRQKAALPTTLLNNQEQEIRTLRIEPFSKPKTKRSFCIERSSGAQKGS
jgi:hypothetical protein